MVSRADERAAAWRRPQLLTSMRPSLAQLTSLTERSSHVLFIAVLRESF